MKRRPEVIRCQLLATMLALTIAVGANAQQPGGAGTVGTNAGGPAGNVGSGQSSAASTSPGFTVNGAPPSGSVGGGGTAGAASPVFLQQQPGNFAPQALPNAQSPRFSPQLPGDQAAQPNLLPGTGESASNIKLPPNDLGQDTNQINSQNDEFNKRYLLGEAIELQLPKPESLMPLGGKLPGIRLEANYTEPISLRDAVNYAIANTLAIRISYANMSQQRWNLVGQLGGFLPNIILNLQKQYLQGSSLLGGVTPITFQTPNASLQAGIQYFGSQGGAVLFGSLSSLHNFRAAKAQVAGSINDTLLAVAKGYYNLVNNQALLQIQTRAVDVSRAQVTLNQQLESAGTGTKFQVLQAETQLARDEQNLLAQEVALRNASIDLATILNLNAAVNFLSVESTVRKVRLIDPSLDINRLIALAILNRPELKQYEQLRIAARRQIQVAAAPLYPQFQFFANILGNGATFDKTYALTTPSYTAVPLAAAAPAPVLNVPRSVLGNNSTVAVATNTTAANAANPVVLGGERLNPATYSDRQVKKSYSIGVRFDYNFSGAGVPYVAAVQAARANARIAMLNSNQELINVLQQVRESYLNSQTAERQIEVADKAVISSTEELRLSRVRLANGVGTNIDVINAQRDFITALVNKANAIITFNVAQAQLLHDMGLISVETLTSGRLVRQ